MTLIPRSDRKRVYALLSSVPAVSLYLVLLAYMYFGNMEPLADGVLLASVIGETAIRWSTNEGAGSIPAQRGKSGSHR